MTWARWSVAVASAAVTASRLSRPRSWAAVWLPVPRGWHRVQCPAASSVSRNRSALLGGFLRARNWVSQLAADRLGGPPRPVVRNHLPPDGPGLLGGCRRVARVISRLADLAGWSRGK